MLCAGDAALLVQAVASQSPSTSQGHHCNSRKATVAIEAHLWVLLPLALGREQEKLVLPLVQDPSRLEHKRLGHPLLNDSEIGQSRLNTISGNAIRGARVRRRCCGGCVTGPLRRAETCLWRAETRHLTRTSIVAGVAQLDALLIQNHSEAERVSVVQAVCDVNQGHIAVSRQRELTRVTIGAGVNGN